VSGPMLVRRASAQGPRQEYPQSDPDVDQVEEPQPELPKSRRVWFEIPEGFMASISLVPYTELPPDSPVEPEAGS
jgi:hypothetical protein